MTDFQEIASEALDASGDAAFAYLNAYGDNADCGGAWVVVDGRSGYARHLRKIGVGRKHATGGLAVVILGALPCQSRIIYEKGCDAYVAVLRKHGIEAWVHSYAD